MSSGVVGEGLEKKNSCTWPRLLINKFVIITFLCTRFVGINVIFDERRFRFHHKPTVKGGFPRKKN
jgi:hypothetical protein